MTDIKDRAKEFLAKNADETVQLEAARVVWEMEAFWTIDPYSDRDVIGLVRRSDTKEALIIIDFEDDDFEVSPRLFGYPKSLSE